MPTFKTSPNGNSYFSLPYFNVLSENKILLLHQDFIVKISFYFKMNLERLINLVKL